MEKLTARQQRVDVMCTSTLPARLSNRVENSEQITICNHTRPFQVHMEIQLEPYPTVLRTIQQNNGKERLIVLCPVSFSLFMYINVNPEILDKSEHKSFHKNRYHAKIILIRRWCEESTLRAICLDIDSLHNRLHFVLSLSPKKKSLYTSYENPFHVVIIFISLRLVNALNFTVVTEKLHSSNVVLTTVFSLRPDSNVPAKHLVQPLLSWI